MGLDDFAERVSRVAMLAEPLRRRLFDFVVAHGDPVSRDQAAQALGIPRPTAKFHLDRLVGEGLLDTEYKRLTGRSGPGAGRPSKLYRRSTREVSVTVPARRYDLAGQLMARAIERTGGKGRNVLTALRTAAAEHGRAVGDRARAVAGPEATVAERRRAVVEVLTDGGYQPRTDGTAVTLENCPFHALAREHTALVCGMNHALLTEAAERSGSEMSADLAPHPQRCCVVLTEKADPKDLTEKADPKDQ
jgi:predicted ArsR family transcriptional regulator